MTSVEAVLISAKKAFAVEGAVEIAVAEDKCSSGSGSKSRSDSDSNT